MPSDTNRVELAFYGEVTAGTVATGTYFALPFTGTTDMGSTPETVVSDVIRSDRQVTDLIKVNESISGSFDSELIPGDYLNNLMYAASQADLSNLVTEAALCSSVSVTVAGQTFTIGTGTYSATPSAGEWVEITSGAVTEYHRLTAATSTVLTIEGTTNLVTSTMTITRAGSAYNGTTKYPMTFKRTFTDATIYEYLAGMEVDTFSVTASSSSIVTYSLGLVGMNYQILTAPIASTSTGTFPTSGPFNASSNVATIGEGGTGLQVCTELTMEIANNLRERNVIGTTGAHSIGSGEFNVSGQLSVYFEDETLIDKLRNNTTSSISFGFTDGNGAAIIFDMPAVKFTEGVPEVGGKNDDVMLNLGYQAFRDPTLGYTLRTSTFAA